MSEGRKRANARLKTYPDGSRRLVATVGEMGRSHGVRAKPDREGEAPEEREQRERENRDRARRRARTAVRDLALSNHFEWFVTLTLDPRKIDRYDPAAVVRKAGQWLSNAVRRRGLRYVLVPEHHKDGAIHFHGFMSGDLDVTPSGRKDKGGHDVYNIGAWPFGFSTAIRPYGEHAAAVAYCCKYIAKQDDKIGGRWYYSGGDLLRPIVEEVGVDTADLDDLGAYQFKPKGTNWPVWILELPASDTPYTNPRTRYPMEGLVDLGLQFQESLSPPAGWDPSGPWAPTVPQWGKQMRMEELGE